ncbi:hypothetical protein KJ966_12800 [bacterium]|nr:hypothetical protein [bacterium]
MNDSNPKDEEIKPNDTSSFDHTAFLTIQIGNQTQTPLVKPVVFDLKKKQGHPFPFF